MQAGAEQLTETPGAAGAVASSNNFPFPSTCFHHLITFLHDTPSKTCCINFQLCGWLMCLLIISTKTRPVQRHQNDIIIIVQSSAVAPNVWHRLWLSNHWESLHRHQVVIRSPSGPWVPPRLSCSRFQAQDFAPRPPGNRYSAKSKVSFEMTSDYDMAWGSWKYYD